MMGLGILAETGDAFPVTRAAVLHIHMYEVDYEASLTEGINDFKIQS